MCVLIHVFTTHLINQLMLYMCRHTAIFVSSYWYICVLIVVAVAVGGGGDSSECARQALPRTPTDSGRGDWGHAGEGGGCGEL